MYMQVWELLPRASAGTSDVATGLLAGLCGTFTVTVESRRVKQNLRKETLSHKLELCKYFGQGTP